MRCDPSKQSEQGKGGLARASVNSGMSLRGVAKAIQRRLLTAVATTSGATLL